MSVEQVAKVARAAPIGTVKSRTARALHRLRVSTSAAIAYEGRVTCDLTDLQRAPASTAPPKRRRSPLTRTFWCDRETHAGVDAGSPPRQLADAQSSPALWRVVSPVVGRSPPSDQARTLVPAASPTATASPLAEAAYCFDRRTSPASSEARRPFAVAAVADAAGRGLAAVRVLPIRIPITHRRQIQLQHPGLRHQEGLQQLHHRVQHRTQSWHAGHQLPWLSQRQGEGCSRQSFGPEHRRSRVDALTVRAAAVVLRNAAGREHWVPRFEPQSAEPSITTAHRARRGLR